MLTLQLEATERLDRYFEAVGKALASLVEEAIDAGLARVAAYPHGGAVAAASLAFSHLYRLGVTASFRVSVRPPRPVEVPTLLFGFPSLQYKASDIASKLLAFTHAEHNRGHPPPGSVYVGVDGSLSTAYAMAVDAAGLGGISRGLKALSLAGIYLDGRVSRSGRISGIDRVYAERLGSSGELGVRVVTALKVYKPHRLPLCQAMHVTIVPPYPLAVDSEECPEALAAAGLRQASEKPAAALSSGELNNVIDVVSEYLESEVDATAYVSGSLVIDNAVPEDPREAAHAILHAMDSSGCYAAGLLAYVDEEIEYPAVEAALEREAPELVEALMESRPVRARGPGWLRLYALEKRVSSPTLAYLALRSIGAIEEDSVIALPGEEGLLVSPLQASLVDYTLPRRLVESKAAREEGFWLVIPEEGGV